MRARVAAVVFCCLASALPLNAEPVPRHEVLSIENGESRRVVSVRLPSRLGEDDLARIATAMRKNDEAEGRRTIVNFYLPDMKLSDTSWASASFAPQFRIAIHGLTLAEEIEYRAAAAAEKRHAVGMWLTEAPSAPGLLVIYRDKDRIYADWRVRGGHRTVEEVTETRGSHGARFDIPGDRDQQHYVVVGGGRLELREKSGLIAIAEPVKGASVPVARAHALPQVPPDAVTATRTAPPAAAVIRPAGEATITSSIGEQSEQAGFTVVESPAAAATEAIPQQPATPPAGQPPIAPSATLATPTVATPVKPGKVEKASRKLVKAHAGHVQRAHAHSKAAAPKPYGAQADISEAARRFVN